MLSSVLITGIVASPLSFAEHHVNDPAHNGTSTNSTSTEESMVVDDEVKFEMTGNEDDVTDEEELMDDEEVLNDEEEMMEDEIPAVLSPLKQIKEGITPENVVCKEGLELVLKISGQPACIQSTSVEKLIAWGWAQ